MPDEPDLSELTAAVQRVQETYAQQLPRHPKQSNDSAARPNMAEDPEQNGPRPVVSKDIDAAVN